MGVAGAVVLAGVDAAGAAAVGVDGTGSKGATRSAPLQPAQARITIVVAKAIEKRTIINTSQQGRDDSGNVREIEPTGKMQFLAVQNPRALAAVSPRVRWTPGDEDDGRRHRDANSEASEPFHASHHMPHHGGP